MKRVSILSTPALVILFFTASASAQTKQFWPELDTYVKINSSMRLFFDASVTREDREGSSAEVGANVDFYLKPPMKWKRFAGFQLDESKSRPLLLRAGYRYLPSLNAPNEQRIVLEATARFPTKVGILFSDRNRVDLRFIQDSDFSWRYRNRLTVERNFMIHSLRMSPYARVEFYYDSRYSRWSNTATSVGCIFPVGKHVELEPYYEHQNDTGKSPNEQVDAIGFIFSLYFEKF
jgi:Protein of unknown function (DUF2490)